MWLHVCCMTTLAMLFTKWLLPNMAGVLLWALQGKLLGLAVDSQQCINSEDIKQDIKDFADANYLKPALPTSK